MLKKCSFLLAVVNDLRKRLSVTLKFFTGGTMKCLKQMLLQITEMCNSPTT